MLLIASHSKLHPNRRIPFFSNTNILKKPDQLIAYPIFRHKKTLPLYVSTIPVIIAIRL